VRASGGITLDPEHGELGADISGLGSPFSTLFATISPIFNAYKRSITFEHTAFFTHKSCGSCIPSRDR